MRSSASRRCTFPVSNLVWADRHGSIGYKLVGRLPVRGGDCPDLPKPGWTGEYEWEGWVPYEEQPEIRDPDAGYVVTANNKIAGDDFPHHITSDYFDGYRAQRITEMIEEQYEHDLDGFARMQLDMLSIPGLKTVHRLARLRPRDQRETLAIERLRSWHGRMEPDSVAATIYQAFTLRLGREFARAAIGDRDLAERWLDRADNGFMAHVSTPWRWQAHLMALWDEADEELIGRPWDDLVLDALRAAIDDLSDRFGHDPEGWRWGRVHALEFPHALGAAHPLAAKLFNRTLEVGGGQETVAQVGWDPNDPFAAIWCPVWRMVADPVSPERSRWQACSGQSGHVSSPHYDDLQPRWAEGLTQAMTGEGPWETLECCLTPPPLRVRGCQGTSEPPRPDQAHRRRAGASCSSRSASSPSPATARAAIPHLMPLWYVPRDGTIWIWTYAKSQKVKNLERDPRCTLLVETGHEYSELRGIQIEADAEIHRDLDTIVEFAKELTIRYSEGIESVEGDAAEALKAQAPKRVAISFEPKRVATWDHRKLGGIY